MSYSAWIHALLGDLVLQGALWSGRGRPIAAGLRVGPGLALSAGVAELSAVLGSGARLHLDGHVW